MQIRVPKAACSGRGVGRPPTRRKRAGRLNKGTQAAKRHFMSQESCNSNVDYERSRVNTLVKAAAWPEGYATHKASVPSRRGAQATRYFVGKKGGRR